MEIESSAGGGRLQEPCGAHEHVRVLHGEQVLDHLSLPMRRFFTRQGMDFIATADSRLPERVRRDIAGEGGCRPERWVMVKVEEAHLHHARRVPLPEKPDADLRGKESS